MASAKQILLRSRFGRQLQGQNFVHGAAWCSVEGRPAGTTNLLRYFSAIAESNDGLVGAYQRLVARGKLQAGDLAQETAVSTLDRLSRDVADGEEPRYSLLMLWESIVLAGWLDSTFAALASFYKRFVNTRQEPLKGIYMHGGVGTGKTMLMDLFYDNARVQKKRRMHFHAFMLEVHMRLHKLSGEGSGEGSDGPINIVAQQILSDARVICLDEFEVTDVADALILRRIFATLWRQGAVLVATSNRTPDQLYWNGLNRHLFVPFIQQLKEYCHVYSLDGGKDYRKGLINLKQVYFYPLTDNTDEAMNREFITLTGGYDGKYESISVMMGRYLKILAAKGVARASFSYLCGGAYGAADYYAIAQQYRALVLERIPWLGDPVKENELRRFITLVDVLYESNTILVCSAARPLDRLFDEDSGDSDRMETQKRNLQQRRQGDQISRDVLQVIGEGGSSGRSASMIGDVEWSGTGRPGASLGVMHRSSFTRIATARIISRLMEMQSDAYISKAEQRRVTPSGLVAGQSSNRSRMNPEV